MLVVTMKRPLCCRTAILLHRAKADLTLLDENKNTALHLACSKVRPGFQAKALALWVERPVVLLKSERTFLVVPVGT